MKKILIHNDNGRRDLLGLKLLERALVSQGCKVFFAGRTSLTAKLRRIKPNALIVARGDNPTAKLAADVCPVYILPGEGGRTTRETTLSVFLGRGYSAIKSAEWVRRCYLWNENTRQWLLETGMLDDSQMKVVGNPRLDIYKNDKYRSIAEKKARNGRLKIGIAFSATSTSACFGPPRYAEVYHDHIGKDYQFSILWPGRGMEDILWRDHSILRNMMHVIKDIGETTDHEMILRPSPLEGISEYPFLEKRYPGRFKVHSKETLAEFLSDIDVLLTCWSTVGIEALLNNIPVISINGLLNQERLFDHINKVASGFESYVLHYHSPQTFDELLRMVDLAKSKKLPVSPLPYDRSESMFRDIYGWDSNKAHSCHLIAEDIANDLDDRELENYGPDKWRQALPLRYSLPPILAEYAVYVRDIWKAKRSGEFQSYMSFLRCRDPYVSRLLRRI